MGKPTRYPTQNVMKKMPHFPNITFFVLAASSLAWGQSAGDLRGEGDLAPVAMESIDDFTWDARAVEHLLNRAGFGAHALDIRRGLRFGQERLVSDLIQGEDYGRRFTIRIVEPNEAIIRDGDDDERRRERKRVRKLNRYQSQEFLAWWVDRMLDGQSPLRERMTLFWHGFFTSDSKKVRAAGLMINQNELLRAHALGNFGELLHSIVLDPAMLVYLDNTSNTKHSPNENLARELMELFSLGEGNYTEDDIREVARALTGYGTNREREFYFNRRLHDSGVKTVLGVEGRHGAKDVVEIILAQPACARWVAGSIITYLEGQAPNEERLEEYAELLRDESYEIAPMLEKLLLDEEFYRAEIVGARVSSPIDYLVGTCRRLDVNVGGEAVACASGMLGMTLFEPPNVKGWNEGPEWITTATLMNRANLAGVLLGTIRLDEMTGSSLEDIELSEEERASLEDPGPDFPSDEGMMGEDDEMMSPSGAPVKREQAVRSVVARLARALHSLGSDTYRPRLNLSARLSRSGSRDDKAIVDFMCTNLLAIEAPLETRRMLVDALRTDRKDRGLMPRDLVEETLAAENVLRRLAHLILSLPEAQLG